MNETPARTAREDSPASGPSPEVQVPGKIDSETLAFMRFGAISMARIIERDEAALLKDMLEPIPADDEQPETAA